MARTSRGKENDSVSAHGKSAVEPPRSSGIPRRHFLLSLAAAATAGCAALQSSSVSGERRSASPNIVLIYIDDLGYADLGCQGSKDLHTPNIDSLARDGVRFTAGYVMAPLCSPSRAALMTGRYQQRFGHEFNTGGIARTVADDIGLPTSEITTADVLKNAGYATCAIGKWHLGARDKYHPLNRGFDEYFGFLGGGHSYIQWDAPVEGAILRGMQPAQGDEYLTDAFSREAASFIRRQKDRPFFLYLCYNAVHTPLQVTEKYLSRFPDITDPKRRTMAAMLSAADDGVGEVLKAVDETGRARDTLIFFISDNGGPTPANASRNDPLRAGKATMYEGGIRIPFMMRWPARIPAGKVCDQPLCTLDVLPTVAAAAAAKLPADRPIDGVDLMPYITGAEKGSPHSILFWRMGDQRAVRKGDWKLVQIHEASPALYNLASDIGESKDLSAARPEMLKELESDYAKWESKTVQPRWTTGRFAGAQRAAEQAD